MRRRPLLPIPLAVLVCALALALVPLVVDADRSARTTTRDLALAVDTSPAEPVMGAPLLTAAELVTYYKSFNHLPNRTVNLNPFTTPPTTTPVAIETLADLFIAEGNRYNVRGDIAFAQSIVETAWFNFPDYGQVRPWNNNFAGIGACDSCDNGWQFPSLQDGVRAQMQLLRNYADAAVRAANLPDPPLPSLWGSTPAVAIDHFDHFSHKGRAPLWNNMGNGNWATSTTYSTTVLGVYHQMVAATPRVAATLIQQKYDQLGGAASFLGAPAGADEATPGGRQRRFANGSIYWSPAAGALEVHGAILGEYLAIGGPSSFAGFPVTDESATWFGTGRFNHFAGASIYWSPPTGAHEVHGGIRDKWASMGWEFGFLGFPVTDELPTWLGIGRFNHFEGGSIYWSPASGAHEVHGAIRDKWASLGWELGFLGYPVTDEMSTPDGVGRFTVFQGGTIYWSPATGAHEVHGGILGEYLALGGPSSFAGFPVTDESRTPDGVGRYNHFQGGSVYWSPASGAHEVHGAIREKWASLGWELGTLGYPVTDETATPDGVGRRNGFQGGTVSWSQATGATVP